VLRKAGEGSLTGAKLSQLDEAQIERMMYRDGPALLGLS
jgi:hypothetical protein